MRRKLASIIVYLSISSDLRWHSFPRGGGEKVDATRGYFFVLKSLDVLLFSQLCKDKFHLSLHILILPHLCPLILTSTAVKRILFPGLRSSDYHHEPGPLCIIKPHSLYWQGGNVNLSSHRDNTFTWAWQSTCYMAQYTF